MLGASGGAGSSPTSQEMDMSDGKSILGFLKTLGRQPDDMLRFFDRKEYYVLQGRDADTVAVEYFKSSACVKYWGSGESAQPYLSVNHKMGAQIIRKALLEQRRRVEIYKMERGTQWILDKRGSPGNLQAFDEDLGLAHDTSPVLVSVRLGNTAGSKGYAGNQTLVGVAFIDCSARTVRAAEFEDDEHLSTLESLVCQQGTRECLLPAELTGPERKKLEDLMELCEVPSSVGKKGTFTAKDAEQDLRRLLGSQELHGRVFESAQGLALSAICAMIKYLDLLANVETHGQWSLDWVDSSQFMRLDSGAMRALSVEPQPGESDKNASLLGIFSQCKTAMGARLVRKWLKQPLLSRFDLEERLDLVETFARGFELRDLLRSEVLPKMGSDLDKLCRKFAAHKATLQDVVMLYHFVLQLPNLLSVLRNHDASSEREAALLKKRFTEPLHTAHHNFSKFCALVDAAVDISAAARHEYVLLPHFNAELAAADEAKEEVREKIEAHHEELRSLFGLDEKTLKLEQAAGFGYVLRVSRKDEQRIRNNSKVKGLTMLSTKKEGVLFRDRVLSSLAEEYSELCAAYDTAQRDIVGKVLDTTSTFCPVVSDCQTLIAELDVLLCFAHVSVSAPEPYVRPKLVPPEDALQRIVLRGCRHPCVERMESVDAFIKNDIELVRGESSMQIVTGPNMGGKSTYIRSAGVNVLLAQVGCFVACDEAEISITDSILARVGAGDCQSRGVSTFMAEMLETATILKGATARSLVIIDELGRGTSTYDGFGLAWAISEHLATTCGCACLFATHFQELTELAEKHPMIVNRHVSAHIEDGEMTMLYRVEDGPSDQSFGINVAEVAKFPTSVVDAAKRKLAELEDYSGFLSSESATKTRRALTAEEHAEGMNLVRTFLNDFSSLPLEGLSDVEASAALSRLQNELSASSNPIIVALCAANSEG